MPEASIASRFLEEVPSRLVEDLGSPPARPQFSGSDYGSAYGGAYATPYPKANRSGRPNREKNDRHYSYEDEDQSGERVQMRPSRLPGVNNRARYNDKTAAPGQS